MAFLKNPSPDRDILSNNRSVSNLPFLSTVLENVAAFQQIAYLHENNLTEPIQSA